MPSRWCPNRHFVSDGNARYCPTCGVGLPPSRPPGAMPISPAVRARNIALVATCSIVVVGYCVAVWYSQAQEDPSTYAARATVAATTPTPGPSPTPTATRTPRPTITPRPILHMTPAELRARWDQLTEIQQKSFVASITGQRIRWACEVFQVREDGSLTLDCESGALFTNIMVRGTIPRAGAEGYNKGQVVTFEADITGIDTLLLFTVNVGHISIIG